MRSKVTALFDYRGEPLSDSATRWRIPDTEIEEQLAALARAHAEALPAEIVETGDAVRCVCVGETSLPGRESVLLYPGRKLPGAEEAEGLVLGKRPGDTFAAAINGTALTLRVLEVLRCCCPPPGDDALVRLERLPGVETLEDYARWYREQNEPVRRKDAAESISAFWLRQIAEKSEYAIDEEEQRQWAENNARLAFRSQVAAGQNPCIPETGFELLTEEEALAQMADRYMSRFPAMLAVRCLVNQRGIVYGEELLGPRYEQIAEFLHCTPEEARSEIHPELIFDNAYMNKAAELLCEEAIPFLEV